VLSFLHKRPEKDGGLFFKRYATPIRLVYKRHRRFDYSQNDMAGKSIKTAARRKEEEDGKEPVM